MTCYLYNREARLEIYATSLYQALRELNYQITLTDRICHENQENDLYLILGGQYVVEKPKHYIIIQTVPTSHLTKVNKIEAYWMDKAYLQLLQDAQAIWDISKENIKIFTDYYQFSNLSYLKFGFSSIMKERVDNLTRVNSLTTFSPVPNQTTQPIVVIGEDRADKWMRSLSESETKPFNLTLRSPNGPYQLIAGLKASGCPVLVLANYDNTYPDISLCCALRHNGITCLVEQAWDPEVNNVLIGLGCHLIPWIRLSKHFRQTVTTIFKEQIPDDTTPKDKVKVKDPSCQLVRNLTSSLLQPLKDYEKGREEISVKNNPSGEVTDDQEIDQNCSEKRNKKRNQKRNERKKSKKLEQKLTLYARTAIKDVNYTLLEDGGIALKLGEIPDTDLPIVTICTPTANRRTLFSLATRNFMSFIYPSEKLRWNILDNGDLSIKDIVPPDRRISYHYQSGTEKLSVAEMRNRLVETSQSDIIIFMDDDDYYPPESILARTKALLKYAPEGIQCVGCRDVASYDLKQGLCAICSNGEEYLTESSLAFTKSFWETRPFNTSDKASEYRYFLEYRQDQIKSIPFQFITIALTHGKNTTGGVRDLDFYRKWKPSENWEDTKNAILNILDEETQDFLNQLKKLVC